MSLTYAISMSQISFTNVTETSGIDHQFKVYEGMFGGGICVIDIDNDGYEDLYMTSGMNDDQLYLNNGDGTFTNIYEGSGLEFTRHFVTQGVSGADVNKDGWTDLFITTITSRDSIQKIPTAHNLLFLNNGDHTFTNATQEYRLDNLNAFSTGVSFGDFNADGYPDAYVGNYFLEYDGPLTEINDATIVNASKTAKGYLLLNVDGKYFKNVYEDYGLDHRGFGFGGLFTDFDNDGDQDLLINHDFGYKAKPNYFLKNNYPQKSFSYIEEEINMDLRINAMASAVGDYNLDGQLDYFVTNIKFNRFMENGGVGAPFRDRAKELGTSIFTISWGANFADFDQDGDLDLFVANGDLNPNCTPMTNFLFENVDSLFLDKSLSSGVNDPGIGRGSVIFDIENDGDMDLLFVNQEAIRPYPVPSRSVLFRNDSPGGNWLKVQLHGNYSEGSGIGSRVLVYGDEKIWIKEIDGGGSSHLSQNSTLAHFGLSNLQKIDSVLVIWPGNHKQVLHDVGINKLLTIEEDRLELEKGGNSYYVILAVILVLIAAFIAYRRLW